MTAMNEILAENLRPGMYVAPKTGLGSEEFRMVISYPWTIDGRTSWEALGGYTFGVPEGTALVVDVPDDYACNCTDPYCQV